MPPLYPPVAVVMSAEGAVLGGVASAVYGATRGRVWPALLLAIVCGRSTAVALSWLLARLFDLPPALSAGALLLQGLPGVALQLAVVPLVLRVVKSRSSLLFGDAR
jgi:hypothetical protein